ncbi:MAG: lasso RiPP family leader peptide-containing protein [Vicinamibacterales bacterium]
MADSRPTPSQPASSSKRPYVRPTLIEYGSISKLTQSGGATRVESGVPSMKMNCL